MSGTYICDIALLAIFQDGVLLDAKSCLEILLIEMREWKKIN